MPLDLKLLLVPSVFIVCLVFMTCLIALRAVGMFRGEVLHDVSLELILAFLLSIYTFYL